MNSGLTLCEFLENTGARLCFYDMGRRISVIARNHFLAFERTDLPYPQPMQQKAWFALVQTRPETSQDPLIWFLRFDLDEQGKLVQATRDYFLQRFLELANTEEHPADLEQALEDNPYTFKPREDKMANLNAILNRDLGRPASQYYQHAHDYFAGKLGWEQWNFVGYQGIADLAARQSESHMARLLSQALDPLPGEPLIALCQCLENHPVGDELAQALLARLRAALHRSESSAAEPAALLRGLAQAKAQLRQQAVLALLAHPLGADPEVLAAIGGRAWESLLSPEVARAYLERLATAPVTQDIFNHCLADLLRMPGMQEPLLGQLRSADRPEALARAFQAMLQPAAHAD